jgi:crotonobetainyl-CoA:carnitine CoA-transferase CaiB-like acyl-CoA transferase
MYDKISDWSGEDTVGEDTMERLLDEVKVLDLSTYVMGPFAAMMLADMGADVIKVEPPRGDPNRRVGRQSGGTGVLFASTNHGKRSIVLDLKDPGDAAVARGLVRWADVLDEATVEALNPRLVHVNLTGWGPGGPWRDRPAFDGLLQAFSGLAWSASTGGEPELVRFYVGDKVAAVFAAQAVLGGLVRVARTGQGQRLQVNMVDANAYFNFPDTFTARFLFDDAEPVHPEPATMTNTLVRALDGHLVVQPASGRQIRSICEALNRPEWLAEFKAARTNEELTPLLGARIQSVTVTAPVAHWVELFAKHDVPAAPVLDLDGHLEHPQVIANETYGRGEHPGFGAHRVVRYPAREVDGAAGSRSIGTFPDLDEHAAEIRALAARHQPQGG